MAETYIVMLPPKTLHQSIFKIVQPTVKRILQNPCINKLIWYICFFFARIDNIILTCRSLLKYSKVIINSFFIDNNSNIYTHTPLLVVIIFGGRKISFNMGGQWAFERGWALGNGHIGTKN